MHYHHPPFSHTVSPLVLSAGSRTLPVHWYWQCRLLQYPALIIEQCCTLPGIVYLVPTTRVSMPCHGEMACGGGGEELDTMVAVRENEGGSRTDVYIYDTAVDDRKKRKGRSCSRFDQQVEPMLSLPRAPALVFVMFFCRARQQQQQQQHRRSSVGESSKSLSHGGSIQASIGCVGCRCVERTGFTSRHPSMSYSWGSICKK